MQVQSVVTCRFRVHRHTSWYGGGGGGGGVGDDVGKRAVGSASCAVGSGAEASSIGFRVSLLSTSICPYCPTYISFIRHQPSQLRRGVLEIVVMRGNSSGIQQCCNRMCS